MDLLGGYSDSEEEKDIKLEQECFSDEKYTKDQEHTKEIERREKEMDKREKKERKERKKEKKEKKLLKQQKAQAAQESISKDLDNDDYNHDNWCPDRKRSCRERVSY